jgi:hypothetical protein
MREFFPSQFSEPPVEALVGSDDLAQYDNALFVRQLKEAGHTSTDSARGSFFAAEVVARDVLGRGDPEAVMGLHEIDTEVHAAWEVRFNSYAPDADASGRMTSLISDVLNELNGMKNPSRLNLRPAHRRGFMHRVVDDRRAGWVTYWREVVASSEADSVDSASSVGLS